MPLHLDAAAFMKQREAWGVRPTTELSVEEAREQTLRVAKLMGAGEPVAKTEDHTMAGPHGDIPLRIYTPQGSGPFPVLVFYHGGGWVVGNLDSADMFCRLMTNAAGCVVVSVNYHHAPEHKFPTMLTLVRYGQRKTQRRSTAMRRDLPSVVRARAATSRRSWRKWRATQARPLSRSNC
jgi:acetyl esterase/lipase